MVAGNATVDVHFYGDREISNKKTSESKWDSFDEFVNIVKEYVDNEYYGGFECKIEKGVNSRF